MKDDYRDFPPIRRNNNYDDYRERRSRDSELWGVQSQPIGRRESARKDMPESVSLPASGLEDSNVIICNPKEYRDVQGIIDNLKRREAVIVDLNNIADESAQRILDILSGAVYGLSGSIMRITGALFLLTPAGVSIKVPKDLKERLEGK
ncbi:MAG: cell division protein SepF [Christensenellales bacterium]|jgi:cell division inhibitor SepF